MERKYESAEKALSVAKEAVFLAWQACGGPMGMGVFQDRGPKQDREAVWDHAYNERDYAGGRKGGDKRINCDYVMGRMMKLRFTVDGERIEYPDHEPRGDYQAWCYRYRTFAALFDAAEESLAARQAKAA